MNTLQSVSSSAHAVLLHAAWHAIPTHTPLPPPGSGHCDRGAGGALVPEALLEAAAPSILDLHRGPLLQGEPDAAWLLPARNRLAGRFQRFVTRLGEHLETQRRFSDAQALSKESEEALLYRDMRDDAVQQLVRRLRAAKLKS